MINDPQVLYKLMVLYMLRQANLPLSNEQISEFFLSKEYTNYLSLQQVIGELFDKIIEINKTGITILLVEQNAKIAMRVSDYTYVLEQGRVAMEGPSETIRQDANVIKTYLGKFAATGE